MEGQSIRQFATESRVHVAIAVADVERSRVFYEKLFGVAASKVRTGYAKLEVAEPPLNLALNEVPGTVPARDGVSHFGIEVKSRAIVDQAKERLEAGGLAPRPERVTCCFADQDKVYVTDPDGHEWEIFVVLADAPTARGGACCADG